MTQLTHFWRWFVPVFPGHGSPPLLPLSWCSMAMDSHHDGSDAAWLHHHALGLELRIISDIRDKWVDGGFLSLAPSSPENNLTLSSEPLSSGNDVGLKQFIRNIKTRILFQEGKLQTIRVCKTLNCRSSWWSQRNHILISQEFADH